MGEGGGGGALRELLAVFGFSVDESGLKKGEQSLENLKQKLQQFAEAALAAFAIEGIRRFVEAQTQAMKSIELTSARLGISTDKVQEFKFAAESMGLESETLLNLMGRLQVSQAAAASGAGTQGKAFAQLGVRVKDTSGHMKSADELLLDVADGISKTKDASQQAALATQLFGRQGRSILPFLKEGRAGVAALTKDFKLLGGGFDEISLKKAKEYEKQQARLALVMTSVKSAIVGVLLPPITWLVGKITAGVNAFRQWAKGTEIVRVGLITLAAVAIALAAPVIAAWLPVIAPFLLWAAALAAVILIIEDIVGFFTGKDSLIGEAMDKIFGKGTSLVVLQELRSIWHDIVTFIKDAVMYAREFGQFVSQFSLTKHFEAARQVKARGGSIADVRQAMISGVAPAEATGLAPVAPEVAEANRQRAILRSQAPALTAQIAGAVSGGISLAPVVNVNVQAPPGTDPKRFGQVAAAAGAEEIHRETRRAAATLQRAPSQ